MTSLAAFTTTAAGVTNPRTRRFVAGAAYLLYDRATLRGEPYATAITGILTVPQYANALSAASLTAAFQAVDAP